MELILNIKRIIHIFYIILGITFFTSSISTVRASTNDYRIVAIKEINDNQITDVNDPVLTSLFEDVNNLLPGEALQSILHIKNERISGQYLSIIIDNFSVYDVDLADIMWLNIVISGKSDPLYDGYLRDIHINPERTEVILLNRSTFTTGMTADITFTLICAPPSDSITDWFNDNPFNAYQNKKTDFRVRFITEDISENSAIGTSIIKSPESLTGIITTSQVTSDIIEPNINGANVVTSENITEPGIPLTNNAMPAVTTETNSIMAEHINIEITEAIKTLEDNNKFTAITLPNESYSTETAAVLDDGTENILSAEHGIFKVNPMTGESNLFWYRVIGIVLICTASCALLATGKYKRH